MSLINLLVEGFVEEAAHEADAVAQMTRAGECVFTKNRHSRAGAVFRGNDSTVHATLVANQEDRPAERVFVISEAKLVKLFERAVVADL